MHAPIWTLTLAAAALLLCGSARSAAQVNGRVLGSGKPISQSTVTLWAAGSDAPTQMGQAKTDADGRFKMRIGSSRPPGSVLYLVAQGGTVVGDTRGDNPAIALLAILGLNPPTSVIVNELTTVASVWTGTQFLDGDAMRGHSLGLRIAAGNVPNFVDPVTGGYGSAIQSPLNGPQTPTMANFATLASVIAGCVSRVIGDACPMLFAAAAGPVGAAPTTTLTAAEAIARYSWYKPERIFRLLNAFYPFPAGKNLRPVPFMPYLQFAPSAWVLPLKFDGGGYRAGGKAMFDSEGNLWVADNWTVGWQGQDALWQGNATKFAPDGKPLSPSPTGYTGGGMEGGTFGTAVDAKDNVWFSNYGSKAIAVFDKNGQPLTPPEGITFGGKLGLMQGIIATPSGDLWALGIEKSQLVHFPRGDPTKGQIVCEGDKVEPCKSFRAPFHLGIDQQDRILGFQQWRRSRRPVPRCRPDQGRDLQDRIQQQRACH